ncbi:hypothetical protein DPMN_036218 [Dreissena polymorpha]|uniref:Uncharacterized protein n=1 Tax=Dreissena polymorpha TaxID=45954 RepID=A0A9D4MC57_DREPO|nr:hypothetical protein DPMN_036218 [Dreissena polymorpha]
MVNSTNNTSADIIMNGEKLEELTTFKNLGAPLLSISFPTKYRLHESLVFSLLMYGS